MSPVVVIAVLVAALSHALWNTILKAQPDRFGGLTIQLSVCSFLSAFGAFYYGPLPPDTWGYLAGGVFLHMAYNYLLIVCYRLGDISLTYPILRGAAPPIATILAFLSLQEAPHPLALIGILTVSAGILYMVRGKQHGNGKAVAAALLTALTIASYSLIDALGARASGNAVQYLCWLLIFEGPIFLFFTLINRRPAGRVASVMSWRHFALAALGGALSLLAYGLVIYAYTLAQVGVVTALREVSVVFGALLGMYCLGEEKSRRRIVGAVIIVIGIFIIIAHPG